MADGAQAVDVQLTPGAGAIEANFPAQTAAAAAAHSASAAAAGYPTRALAPLRGALVRESVLLMEQAAAAFKATSRIDIELDTEDVSSDATKAKFLDKGTPLENNAGTLNGARSALFAARPARPASHVACFSLTVCAVLLRPFVQAAWTSSW
jgi:hypothetical protein